MYSYPYPRPAVTTDCVVFGRRGDAWHLLLVERRHAPYQHHWALPGGFLDMDETVEECARRELMEETGLTVGELVQVGAFSEPGRDPRGRTVTIAFYALTEVRPVVGGDDARRAEWFPLDALPPLAFDHAKIWTEAYRRAFSVK